ncbi:MAG: FIST N-terminal domain-containing protein [Bacilli bacterium]|nr:FIST N-terminal domain-containing protein [Bacilli bacterium]
MLNSKVGYSNNKDAYEAGKETATKATEGLNAKIGLLFNSVGYDQKKLMEGIKSVAKDVDVIGCTSSAGIITPDGYMIDEDGTAGMLTLGGDDLTVACYGMAKGKSARETGREVAKKALEKAGLDYAPDYFFMSASPAEEEEYIKGIQDIIGRVPCFGGSAADNTVEGKWSIFYNDTIFNDGVVAAFFYTANDIATIYTGAYNETKDMGIITKLNDTRVLAEIDREPALDKYKNWRGLDDEAVTGGNLLVTTITSPLGVKDRLGNLTAIRHPMNGNDDKSMNIGANLAVGTTVIRMEATVDELINSTGKTLKELKKKCPNAAGYLLIHCGGRRLGIGDRMNEVYEQLKKEAGDVPFLVAFTFGEYGYTDDDQTNTTGGLMLSFTAFEK